MPNINDLKTRSQIELADLPNPEQINPVRIARFDSEDFDAKEGKVKVTKTRHLMYLEGYTLPLRLHNKRLDAISRILGSENTEDWYGRMIGLTAGEVEEFGKTKIGVVIYPFPIDPNALQTCQRVISARAGRPHSAFPATSPAPSDHAASAALPTGPGGQKVSPTAAGPIGKENAAKVIYALALRERVWEDLLAHLKRNGADQGCYGVMPFEVPGHVLPWAKQLCRDLPAMKNIEMDPFVKKQIAAWEPPPLPPANEVIDKATGEVVKTDAAPLPPDESDIPF